MRGDVGDPNRPVRSRRDRVGINEARVGEGPDELAGVAEDLNVVVGHIRHDDVAGGGDRDTAGVREFTIPGAGFTELPQELTGFAELLYAAVGAIDDPGVSFFTRRPVAETLFPRLLNTLFLAGVAFVIVMPLALLLGLFAGLNEGKFADRFLSVSSLIATATPEFASGVFLILIFATWLKLVPGAVVV